MKKVIIVMSIIFGLPLLLLAQDYVIGLKKGNQLYNDTRYEEAIKAYTELAQSPRISVDEKSDIMYNLGNALAKKGDWKNAIGAYGESLNLRPNNYLAQYNLTYARNKVPPESRQNQDNKPDHEKSSDQDSNKNNPPKQSESKIDKAQAEQLLKALREEEVRIQKNNQTPNEGSNFNRKNW
jgi:tetratricopeptide (TPR) repeat protein